MARRLTAFAILLVAVAVLAAPAADAAYPGQNGKLVFSDTLGAFHKRLATMNPDGTGWVRITPDDFNNDEPAWSADGSKIAFSSRHDADGREDIWFVNADGSGLQRVTSILGQDRSPTWSPDGSKLAFSTNQEGNSEIYVVNADGGAPHNITNNVENQETFPAWSPDGTKIAYISRTTNFFPNPLSVWVMNADGTDQTQLRLANTGNAPDWSPDGSKLAYSESHDCGGGMFCHQIHVMNADGTNDQVVSTGSGFGPHWSPDGTKFVFMGGAGIGTMNADGTNPVTLTTGSGGQQSDPDWQPVFGTGYPRPKSASPTRASLVPAFAACAAPNRTHGPPLAFGSCNPPAQESSTLTVGTPDANGFPAASTGSAKLAVVPGDPGPPDEADVNVSASITDVRCAGLNAACPGGAGSDYEGSLLLEAGLRVTDKLNGPGANESGTIQDTSLRVPFSCAATGSSSGATCSVTTTADAVVPGLVTEQVRSIWQLGKIAIRDEGANGTGYESCPPTCGDGDEAFFMRQGIFVP